jgi:hypothetical protein
VVNARDGVDYSLSEDEMSWFLEFSPARWISVPEIQLAFFVAHGGGPAVRSLRGGGVPGMAHGAKAPFAGLWWPGDDLGVEVPYGPW